MAAAGLPCNTRSISNLQSSARVQRGRNWRYDPPFDDCSTLNYLGYMYAEAGTNLDRAADMLNKAVRREPRNGAYIDSLGWVYFRQGKLDLAEKYLTDATVLLPHDATVREHLGDVFAKRGDYHKALDLYRTALTLEPEPKDEVKLRSKIAEVEKQTK